MSGHKIIAALYAILDKSGKLLQNGSVGANVLTNLTNPINRAPCAWFRRLAVCLTQS